MASLICLLVLRLLPGSSYSSPLILAMEIEGLVLVRKVFVPTHAVVSTAKLSKSWDALNNTRSMKGAGLPSLPC